MTTPFLGRWADRYPTLPYVAPFAIFLVCLSLASKHWISASLEAPVWVLGMAAVCWFCWPAEISLRVRHPLASVALGVAVFGIWIGPDVLIPGYREGPLLSNSVMGHLHSSIPSADLRSPWVLSWRTARAVLIVPLVEELFWRAWLMRWLIDTDFRRVPLGAYAAVSFWLTAILFASEHGPYWDVGLVTGIIYNAWMVRTKSVGDCVLAHAVTNGALSAYVVATSQWQYWQ